MPDTTDPGDLDGLYQVPPDGFVAARDILAKRLRAGGERDEAQRVAKLRRPPPSAWALNQVARRDPAVIGDLLTAGAALRQATADAMGGDASGLRSSEAAERAAVGVVMSSAAALADRTGLKLTEPHRQRMIATLRAAVLDEAVAASLREGILDQDHEAAAFGLGFVPDGSVRAPLPAKPTPTAKRPAAEARAKAAVSPADPARADRVPDPASPPDPAPPDPAPPEPALADPAPARRRERAALIGRLERDSVRLAQRAERLEREAADAERRSSELRSRADGAAREAAAAREALDAARAEE